MADWKLPFVQEPEQHDCGSSKYEYIYELPETLFREKFIMNNCAHNEFVGFRNRYLKEMQHDLDYDFDLVEIILDDLCRELQPHFEGKQSVSKFFDSRSGNMKKRYMEAIDNVDQFGFRLFKHNKCSAFVKNELYDEIKPPRMIINRDPRFNLVYSMFTIPLEHAMMKIPQFSKGKNYIERGKQFSDLVHGEWILEGDCSKFESSQRLPLLKQVELGIFKRLLSHEDYNILEHIFWAKMNKCGFSAKGCKFSFYSMRGSGDMDTGLFNSILMYVACRYFEIVNRIHQKQFIVDGDDNLLKIPIGMENYENTFKQFGFDAKLILRRDYHDAEYCSGKFLQINSKGDFMYFQNILKIMNNMAIFRKNKFRHCKAAYYYTLGYMYKQIYGKIPLYNDFAEYLMRDNKSKFSKSLLEEINPLYLDILVHGENKLEIEDSVITEMLISFNLNYADVSQIKSFCSGRLNLTPEESKRYRSSNLKSNINLNKIQHVSDYLDEELRRGASK